MTPQDLKQQLLVATWQAHRSRLYRTACGITRDLHLAEDACQQAMLKAWSHASLPREPEFLKSWLFRVVVNECLQVLRRTQRERRKVMDASSCLGVQADDEPESFENHQAFATHLASLPDKTRIVLLLRIAEGMSGNDVKDILGCSAAEVSRRLHAGISKLRESMRGLVEER